MKTLTIQTIDGTVTKLDIPPGTNLILVDTEAMFPSTPEAQPVRHRGHLPYGALEPALKKAWKEGIRDTKELAAKLGTTVGTIYSAKYRCGLTKKRK